MNDNELREKIANLRANLLGMKSWQVNPATTSDPQVKAVDQLLKEHETAVMTLIHSYANEARKQAVSYAFDRVLQQWNKAGEEDLNDVRILTNSDSWHYFRNDVVLELEQESKS